ncbi:MAG: ribosome silencing factor [Clostridiales bacterium]|nr:ribosome silencing factor [Clostridiales bacterium]
MTQNEMIKIAVEALDSKRAEDIQVLGIRDLTIIADYFIIANGNSNTQAKSLADEVEFKLKEKGITPTRVEGYQGGNWIILDYSDIVIHVFYKETRNFYTLERLWSDAEQVDVSQYLTAE